ncbi:MAG: glutamate synthase subunit alpha, partial [Halobacteriales archaeon]
MRDEKQGINARERSNCGVGVLMDMSGEKSHEIVQDSLEALENLDHRGARGAEEDTGDGAGILIQKPHEFFVEEVGALDERNLGFDDYGVGQAFLPKDDEAREEAREAVEEAAADEGFEVVAWRDVPTDNSELGESAVETEPDVWQFFVVSEDGETGEELDSALYVLRRVIEEEAGDVHDRFYVCSLDRRKVVYKGLLTNAQVREYYHDLNDERFRSSLALVHSRFSTNTLGAWELAHPFRNIIHNGEINTLRGNLNWMSARESDLETDEFDVEKVKPVTSEDQSDTAVVDNVLELLVEGGRELPRALRMLIPEAWNKDETMDDDRRDWYDYHSTMLEPWDGPALVAFTDGYSVGAVLDRNGLRPCRYCVTEDDRLIMASETGVLETPPEKVRKKGRLKPGQMFYADP